MMTGKETAHRRDDVLRFWFQELTPQDWYAGGDALDALIRDRFEDLWHEAMQGALGLWLTDARGTLAYIVLTDQLPRNMFRDTPEAFASDASARAAAKMAISHDWDMQIPEPDRQFIYMPLMHSENLIDQDRCLRLFRTRMPETGPNNLLHARAHREIIRRFGRFPFRNAALGRDSTPEERGFLADGGYRAIVNSLPKEPEAD